MAHRVGGGIFSMLFLTPRHLLPTSCRYPQNARSDILNVFCAWTIIKLKIVSMKKEEKIDTVESTGDSLTLRRSIRNHVRSFQSQVHLNL